MNEKKKCPNCPRAEVGSVTFGPATEVRDKIDIEWLVEQRVQRTLLERQSYSNGLYDGIFYAIIAVVLVAIILWPEIKKATAA